MGGWVNDADTEKDWKRNILKLQDGRFSTTRQASTPTLCAGCHGSNALPGTGLPGIPAMTAALHASHAGVIDPSTVAASTPAGLSLDAIDNRNACYLCHPGSVTKCLRGAMCNAVDASGNALMGCQSCHGNMTKVGDPARVGWLEEPTCQACHFDGKRTISAVDGAGNLVVPADTRFATNPNVPAAGFNLYRFSKGHGDLQCEACHGATYAVYPSSHENDNLQSIALQGYAGTVRECTVCHATPPMSLKGGPHGMHTIGAAWVSRHGNMGASAARIVNGARVRGRGSTNRPGVACSRPCAEGR